MTSRSGWPVTSRRKSVASSADSATSSARAVKHVVHTVVTMPTCVALGAVSARACALTGARVHAGAAALQGRRTLAGVCAYDAGAAALSGRRAVAGACACDAGGAGLLGRHGGKAGACVCVCALQALQAAGRTSRSFLRRPGLSMGKRCSMSQRRPPYVTKPAAAASDTSTRKTLLATCKRRVLSRARCKRRCPNWRVTGLAAGCAQRVISLAAAVHVSRAARTREGRTAAKR